VIVTIDDMLILSGSLFLYLFVSGKTTNPRYPRQIQYYTVVVSRILGSTHKVVVSNACADIVRNMAVLPISRESYSVELLE
jgi:hypothetical protein